MEGIRFGLSTGKDRLGNLMERREPTLINYADEERQPDRITDI